MRLQSILFLLPCSKEKQSRAHIMGFQVRYSQRHPQCHIRTTTPVSLLYHYQYIMFAKPYRTLSNTHTHTHTHTHLHLPLLLSKSRPPHAPSAIPTSLTNHWLAFDRKPDIHNKPSQIGIANMHRTARKEKLDLYIRTADQLGSFASHYTHSYSAWVFCTLYMSDF